MMQVAEGWLDEAQCLRAFATDCSGRTVGNAMKRILTKAVMGLIALVAAVYAADYLAARFHVPPSRQLYSSIVVQPYYAVKLKDNKTEFYFMDPQTEICIHAIFPHFGHRPCWYVSRHTQMRIDM